ncbi:MAG: hypothetical protein GTN76_03950 [Candidatus Aenigmarchaeota archaeon]|nr:hypothetical protein [Candidatus Aenigmarchaeota archaeon]
MSDTGRFDTKLVNLYAEHYAEHISVDQTGFDPANVEKYHGCIITTKRDPKHYSTYVITKDGRISGRPSIEGAKIELIGGVDPQLFKELYHGLAWCLRPEKMMSKGELNAIIRNFGQNLKRGLRLFLSITPEYEEKKHRTGMITSPIDHIEYIQ